jgi:ligand-binding SRPBCC domain-containing protein
VASGPRLTLTTRVAAPVPAVLAASLDLDVELAAVRRYGVRTGGAAVRRRVGVRTGERTGGRIGLGETVTWRLGPAGVPLHTSRIVELVEDDGAGGARFVDAMERGLFAAFRHEHRLVPAADGGTVMHDDVRWRSPLGALGRAADAVFVRRALRALLDARNAQIVRHLAAG